MRISQHLYQVLTSKLSGLDLNDGRARGGDSGVVRAQSSTPENIPEYLIQDTTCLLICILKVSPSEDSTEGERERLLSETNSKTRSHSGEDAGIGSEQGELQLHGK